jgi:hypothetical protein
MSDGTFDFGRARLDAEARLAVQAGERASHARAIELALHHQDECTAQAVADFLQAITHEGLQALGCTQGC